MNALAIVRETEKLLALIVEKPLTEDEQNELDAQVFNKKESIKELPDLVKQLRSKYFGDRLWFFLFNPYLNPPEESEEYQLLETQE
jgi:hypothetical protein